MGKVNGQLAFHMNAQIMAQLVYDDICVFHEHQIIKHDKVLNEIYGNGLMSFNPRENSPMKSLENLQELEKLGDDAKNAKLFLIPFKREVRRQRIMADYYTLVLERIIQIERFLIALTEKFSRKRKREEEKEVEITKSRKVVQVYDVDEDLEIEEEFEVQEVEDDDDGFDDAPGMFGL
jgi:hypothetical protein